MKEGLTYKILRTIAEIGDEIYLSFPKHKTFKELFSTYDYRIVNSTLYNLKERGYVEKLEVDGKVTYRLTPKGMIKVIKEYLPKKQKWNGKWRIVIFDIPEKKKKTRELFREKLYELGFKRMQKSVWISPFDVEEYLELITEYFYIKPFVKYITADSISDKERWGRKFKLSNK